MALELQISTIPMPDGTEFPGTPDELKDLIAQFMEITGGETFDGINTGDTTPAAADRDKPWFRDDGAGNFMGWHYWDGAQWSLLGAIVLTGSTATRDGMSYVNNGQIWWNTGSKELEVYDPDGQWYPAMPVPPRVHYDISHNYPQHQLLVSHGAVQAAWTEVDLTSYLNALGLDAVDDNGDKKYQIKAAKIRITVQHGPSGFGQASKSVTVRVASDSSYSQTASDVLQCYSLHTYDDSQASSSGQASGDVPPKIDTYSVYWNLTGDPGNGVSAQIYLTGFIYTTTDAYFT